MSLPRLSHDPREGRDAKSSPPIEWAPELGCWCVFEASAITAVLKSTEFVSKDFAEWHRALGRMGIDYVSVIQILDHIATANEGRRHAEIRRDVARVIATNTSSTKTAVARKVSELVSMFCRAGASIDLVQEILQPICYTMFEHLLGVRCPRQPEKGVSASQIFDLYLSLKRRKEIISRADAILESYSHAGNGLKTSSAYATSLRILGYDSLAGSLACSILHVLKQAPDRRLCDLSYPQTLPKTGVPYVERFAAKDCTLGDASIKRGDRVRVYLDPGSQQGHAENGTSYFGRGRHSCLGEDLSRWLWRTLTNELAQLPLHFTIESEVRRKPDWVFVYYSNLVVRFHA
jgi:cytochrome P450